MRFRYAIQHLKVRSGRWWTIISHFGSRMGGGLNLYGLMEKDRSPAELFVPANLGELF